MESAMLPLHLLRRLQQLGLQSNRLSISGSGTVHRCRHLANLSLRRYIHSKNWSRQNQQRKRKNPRRSDLFVKMTFARQFRRIRRFSLARKRLSHHPHVNTPKIAIHLSSQTEGLFWIERGLKPATTCLNRVCSRGL